MLFKKNESCGEKVLKCPRCKIDMEKLKKENVVIDICNKCSGMWLDKGEVNKLVKIANRIKGTEKLQAISGTKKC